MNWFQIVFLREDSQAKVKIIKTIYGCELISNCIFTWGFTSRTKHVFRGHPLWIDFKLYFYVRIHKVGESQSYTIVVVNWFQIVFLREDSQAFFFPIRIRFRCELISNCIFTWGFTSFVLCLVRIIKLWIDFKLYFYVRIHKPTCMNHQEHGVVNWFQIVFLREDSQDGPVLFVVTFRCELISNCIFTWGFTRLHKNGNYANMLWIDFKLYFYVRIHKLPVRVKWMQLVVNWFQIVFLREDSQGQSRCTE